MHGNEYQFQPPHVGFLLQVLFEVEAIHALVDEPKRVCLGRVHPDEGHHARISVVKKAPYVNLIAISL